MLTEFDQKERKIFFSKKFLRGFFQFLIILQKHYFSDWRINSRLAQNHRFQSKINYWAINYYQGWNQFHIFYSQQKHCSLPYAICRNINAVKNVVSLVLYVCVCVRASMCVCLNIMIKRLFINDVTSLETYSI